MTNMSLTEVERERYHRQILLPNFGIVAQEKLKSARVLCLGAGGLGSPVIMYLAAAGVGALTVVDDDRVENSNLARQIIHVPHRVGMYKAQSAQQMIYSVNPQCQLNSCEQRLTVENARELCSGYDVVIDACDNFTTRYALNDAAADLGIPCVWGAIYRTAGQVTTFHTRSDGIRLQLRDIFPQPPGESSGLVQPIFSPICGIIGTVMAGETMKILTGLGKCLIGRLMTIDALTMETSMIYYTSLQHGLSIHESTTFFPSDTVPSPYS